MTKTETLLLFIAAAALYLQYKASQNVQPTSGNVILGPVQSITPVIDEWVSY